MTIGDLKQTSGELSPLSASSRERMLLRELADNYYGVCLVRVIEGIVHNLNGPLQILYIRSEQLEHSLKQLRGALQSEALTEVEGLAGRMEERIKSLSKSLDDLNVQMGHLTSDLIVERCCETGDVKINQVIENCVFLLNADMFFKHNVKKTFKLDDALPVIKGRKMDFCIIVLALIQNALEAMVDAQDKHLNVESSSQEDKVIIRIQDTGCGIHADKIPLIFEKYYRSQEHKTKGTGLGLAIVKRLIELHHGEINVLSDEAVGSTFIVTLPKKTKSHNERSGDELSRDHDFADR